MGRSAPHGCRTPQRAARATEIGEKCTLANDEDKQYEYFVKKVADWGEAFVLAKGDVWPSVIDDEGTRRLLAMFRQPERGFIGVKPTDLLEDLMGELERIE